MPPGNPRITPFLWLHDKAEEAVDVYTSMFPGSGVVATLRDAPSPEMPQAAAARRARS